MPLLSQLEFYELQKKGYYQSFFQYSQYVRYYNSKQRRKTLRTLQLTGIIVAIMLTAYISANLHWGACS